MLEDVGLAHAALKVVIIRGFPVEPALNPFLVMTPGQFPQGHPFVLGGKGAGTWSAAVVHEEAFGRVRPQRGQGVLPVGRDAEARAAGGDVQAGRVVHGFGQGNGGHGHQSLAGTRVVVHPLRPLLDLGVVVGLVYEVEKVVGGRGEGLGVEPVDPRIGVSPHICLRAALPRPTAVRADGVDAVAHPDANAVVALSRGEKLTVQA